MEDYKLREFNFFIAYDVSMNKYCYKKKITAIELDDNYFFTF